MNNKTKYNVNRNKIIYFALESGYFGDRLWFMYDSTEGTLTDSWEWNKPLYNHPCSGTKCCGSF